MGMKTQNARVRNNGSGEGTTLLLNSHEHRMGIKSGASKVLMMTIAKDGDTLPPNICENAGLETAVGNKASKKTPAA
ncbi:MAG: hypothetical protein R3D71_11040 [Rickettsiales bacterium]